MRKVFRVIAAAVQAAAAFSVWPTAAWAQTPPASAQMCSTCHGVNGLSTLLNAPHLAGQPAIYLVEQMKAYRSGKRSHEVMNVVAKPLSDADIDALAAWYASIKIEVKAP
jgi:cytochrome c553